MTTEAVGLTGVLAAHQWHHTRDTHCTCGFRTPLAQLAFDGFVAHVAEEVRAWLRAALTSPEVVAKAGKAIHARWAHEDDGECLDPSGCGATVEDEAEATAALAGAAETLGAK